MLRLGLLAMFLFIATGHAETRGVDFTQAVLSVDGKPMKDGDQITDGDPRCMKCGDMTYGKVIASCLIQQTKQNQGGAFWTLALKVASPEAKSVVLDTTELHAIATCLDDGKHPAWMTGQIISVVDPTYKFGALQ